MKTSTDIRKSLSTSCLIALVGLMTACEPMDEDSDEMGQQLDFRSSATYSSVIDGLNSRSFVETFGDDDEGYSSDSRSLGLAHVQHTNPQTSRHCFLGYVRFENVDVTGPAPSNPFLEYGVGPGSERARCAVDLLYGSTWDLEAEVQGPTAFWPHEEPLDAQAKCASRCITWDTEQAPLRTAELETVEFDSNGNPYADTVTVAHATSTNLNNRTKHGLGSTDNRFCALNSVEVADLDSNGEWASCKVYRQSGSWTLETFLGNSGDNADIRCSASCIDWDDDSDVRTYNYVHATAGYGNSSETVVLGSTQRRFCALARYRAEEIEYDGESAKCSVYYGDGEWKLQASVGDNSGEKVKCSARCMTW